MEPDATFAYDDRADAVVDLHLPPGPPERLLLLVHGGFWKQEWDRTHTRPMARALADLGWVVATPEYRRVRGGGGWPTTGLDVRAALTSVTARYPGLPVAATGHSAGGHLVLWLAATGAPLDRVVALAPVCDLREAIRLRLGSDATTALLGTAPVENADPMTLLSERPDCEIAVVHGAADDVVPLSLSRGLVARHPWITLEETPGGHFEVIEPDSPAWPTVVAALDRRPGDSDTPWQAERGVCVRRSGPSGEFVYAVAGRAGSSCLLVGERAVHKTPARPSGTYNNPPLDGPGRTPIPRSATS